MIEEAPPTVFPSITIPQEGNPDLPPPSASPSLLSEAPPLQPARWSGYAYFYATSASIYIAIWTADSVTPLASDVPPPTLIPSP